MGILNEIYLLAEPAVIKTMKNMIQNFSQFCVLGALIFMAACEGDYRQRAIGENSEIFVVMDSTQHDSETAIALRETFGKTIETFPNRRESLYNLRFRDFRNNEELDQLRKFKNLIFAAPIDQESNTGAFIRAILSDEVESRVRADESFAFPLNDQWYRDQWSLVLTSTSDSSLAAKIRSAGQRLVKSALDKEFDRWERTVFRRAEQTQLSDSLWADYGWKVRIQHDYVQTVDSANVVVFRRYLPDNDRWMWGWWQDDVQDPEFINPDWINATRDSLMEIFIRGEREKSYVTTEYRRPVLTEEMNTGNRLSGWETLGTWRMTADFMGGPFVNFTYYDPATNRVFMVEYGQFAPSVTKRRFVQQFRAMGRTFESDSSFTPNNYPDNYLEKVAQQ
ncbi:MAG: DUF4837 family protein [Balneolaceae bacterium]